MKVMRICELREARAMSQAVLAARIGATVEIVECWEREIYLPLCRQLPALARALQCSISELFRDDGVEGESYPADQGRRVV